MLREPRGTWTPQSMMTPEMFLTATEHQGITGNRFEEVEQFKRHIEIYQSSVGRDVTLLEIGFGLCEMARHFAQMVGVKNYTGIDYNSRFAKKSRVEHPNIRLWQGNFFRLPVNEKTQFDIVCAPYAFINFFEPWRQEVFLRKAFAHGKRTLLHTTLPDSFGRHENVERLLGKAEFGIDYELTAYFQCRSSFDAIFRSLNCLDSVEYTTYDVAARSGHGTLKHTIISYGK